MYAIPVVINHIRKISFCNGRTNENILSSDKIGGLPIFILLLLHIYYTFKVGSLWLKLYCGHNGHRSCTSESVILKWYFIKNKVFLPAYM